MLMVTVDGYISPNVFRRTDNHALSASVSVYRPCMPEVRNLKNKYITYEVVHHTFVTSDLSVRVFVSG